MRSKWDMEWDRCDNTGAFTMEQCCEYADAVDADHEYETSDDNYESDDYNNDDCDDTSSDDEYDSED